MFFHDHLPLRKIADHHSPFSQSVRDEMRGFVQTLASPTTPSFDPSDATTQPLRPLRAWPALLTLYLLAPITGEVVSGSTPPLQFINPLTLLALTGLYGSGAILARELERRRGLGWPSLLLFGAAYGILEEGLVVTSWFNPKLISL